MRFFIAAILCATYLSSAVRAADSDARIVQTSGTATVQVKPDQVELRFAVFTFDADLVKAKSANDTACRQMIDFIKTLKVDDRDIQSESMSSERVYEDVRDKPREFRGFNVRRQYVVMLRDVSKFEALSDALLTKPEFSLVRFEYQSSQMRKYRDEARRDAVRAAREKAELLANELKCDLGKPRSINEMSYDYSTTLQQNSNNHAGDDGARADSGGVVSLGQLSVTASVNASFDLEPK